MNNESCETCRFFDRVNDHDGYCRRHAPHPVTEANETDALQVRFAIFPIVQTNDACGEYQTDPAKMP